MRRRQRRLRSWWQHEQRSVAAALAAAATHHSRWVWPVQYFAPRGLRTASAREEEEVHEQHDAPRSQTTGVKDPYLTNGRELWKYVVRKCHNKHVHGPVKGLTDTYRSSSRWHTRAWAHAVTCDAVRRFEDLAGTVLQNDEFHEDPQLEEQRVLEEVPNAVGLAVILVVPTGLRSRLRVNSSVTFAPPQSHWPAKLADTYAEVNQGIGVDLFVLPDSGELVFEFLNIVDLGTRITICFPVPTMRPDDVLLVLEMVWMSWAGRMKTLISDMGGKFEGEFGEYHGRKHKHMQLFFPLRC